jgi:replicative DNA helicase
VKSYMQAERIEQVILSNLINNEPFTRKVIPFLDSAYFHDGAEKLIYKEIESFVTEYNSLPSVEVIAVNIGQRKDITEGENAQAKKVLESLSESNTNLDWLVTSTEKFCKDKAVYNAILKSIGIIEGKDQSHTQDALPSILSEALGVTFDTNVGHDYVDNADDRFEFYHRVEERIPFNLEYFDMITKGGLPKKTLNIALAGTGVGKSLFMCNHAASVLQQGKNVLYITMEMAEERIAERIDANLMNIDIGNLTDLPKTMFDQRLEKIKKKTQGGRLVIKEYPTSSAHTGHFKSLLNELAIKRDFVPDIIFIDYLNICASQRFKTGANVNSYTYIKAIAEELRGLAVEYDLPIVSATQTTRTGYSSTDVGLEDTSESFGLPATADLMFALISTEELEEQGQLMVKQLKNRYNDPGKYKRFLVGIDRAKMQLFDLEQSAQDDLVENMNKPKPQEDDVPLFDKSTFGKRSGNRDFSNFKI